MYVDWFSEKTEPDMANLQAQGQDGYSQTCKAMSLDGVGFQLYQHWVTSKYTPERRNNTPSATICTSNIG